MNTKHASNPDKGEDAIALLVADHEEAKSMFEEFEQLKSKSGKLELVSRICKELTVHMQIEEEIFYPAFRAALKDHELVPEANVEHASVKDLIAQVEGVQPDGDDYDAKVKVMGELVEHHAKEEEDQMFPKAKKARLDLAGLGAQMAERKQELMAAA